MRYTKALTIAKHYQKFEALGFSHEETETLRRAELTLRRWYTRRWNGEIQQDDGGVYFVYSLSARGERYKGSKASRLDLGALQRVSKMLNGVNRGGRYYGYYVQTDPRGCCLYIYERDSHMLQQSSIENVYSTIGHPCCLPC